MSATWVKFAAGASYLLPLTWTLQDGTGADLSGATLTAYLKATPWQADDDAIATPSHTATAASVGSVAFLPAHTSAWRSPAAPWWEARALLADGTQLVQAGFLWLTPHVATPILGPADTLIAGTTVGNITQLATYLQNRYSLTGLTGGLSTDLDGLTAADLAALPDGAQVELYLAGDIGARYRIRANTGAETESAPWKIICDNDTDRLWQLLGVTKQGVPCAWNATTSKFHQIQFTGATNAVTQVVDQTGFTLPA